MRRISRYAELEVPVGGRVERSLQVRLDLTVVCDEVADRLGLDTAIHTYIQYYEATSQDSKTVCSILETVDVSLD